MTIRAIKRWAYGLASAVITGACSAGLGSLGITGANAVGIQIPTLDHRQLGAVAIGGGIVGCMAFLMKSPLPPEDDENQTNK